MTISQAAGRQIAHGAGATLGMLLALLFPCDSIEHTVTVTALADLSSPPFHGGAAIFSVMASATAGIPCSPGIITCFTNLTGQFAAVGPIALKLR